MSRQACETTEVKTKFGKMFVHVEHDPDGAATGVQISTKQKAEDTDIDVIIRKLGDVVDASIKRLRKR